MRLESTLEALTVNWSQVWVKSSVLAACYRY